jgi:O-antigen ligase
VPKYIFLYFALTDFFSRDNKRMLRFFWVLMAVSAVAFLNGIFQSVFGFDVFRHNVIGNAGSSLRITSSFINPNDFGAYIATILPLAFLFLKKEFSLKQRSILFMIFLVGFYCLMWASSRGAWISFIVAMIIFFSVYRKKMLIFVPIAALILVLLSPSGICRVKGLLKPQEESMGERVLLLKGTWSMIQAHPVLGSGINTFMKNFEKYRPQGCPAGYYAHNSYLQMWAEIGIVGLLVFLAVPLIVIIKAFANIKAKIKINLYGVILLGSLCGYLAFLIHTAFDNDLYSLVLTTLFWVFTAYVISLNNYLTKRHREVVK